MVERSGAQPGLRVQHAIERAALTDGLHESLLNRVLGISKVAPEGALLPASPRLASAVVRIVLRLRMVGHRDGRQHTLCLLSIHRPEPMLVMRL